MYYVIYNILTTQKGFVEGKKELRQTMSLEQYLQ